MIELTGKILKLKYRTKGGKSYPAKQRTSPAKAAQQWDNASLAILKAEQKHSREVNARIQVMLVLTPAMKKRFERKYL